MVRFGVLLGGGLPTLLSVGGIVKITDYFGVGVTYGVIPNVTLPVAGEATIGYQQYELYGRVYPFGGAFFLGAGIGYVTVEGKHERTVDISAYANKNPGLPSSVSYEGSGSMKTLVLSPAFGFLKRFDPGFTVGVDFAAVLPIAPSDIELKRKLSEAVPDQVVDQYFKQYDEDINDTLEFIGRTPLPAVNVRLGWIF